MCTAGTACRAAVEVAARRLRAAPQARVSGAGAGSRRAPACPGRPLCSYRQADAASSYGGVDDGQQGAAVPRALRHTCGRRVQHAGWRMLAGNARGPQREPGHAPLARGHFNRGHGRGMPGLAASPHNLASPRNMTIAPPKDQDDARLPAGGCSSTDGQLLHRALVQPPRIATWPPACCPCRHAVRPRRSGMRRSCLQRMRAACMAHPLKFPPASQHSPF